MGAHTIGQAYERKFRAYRENGIGAIAVSVADTDYDWLDFMKGENRFGSPPS